MYVCMMNVWMHMSRRGVCVHTCCMTGCPTVGCRLAPCDAGPSSEGTTALPAPSLLTARVFALCARFGSRTAGPSADSNGSSRSSSSSHPGLRPRLVRPRGRRAAPRGPPRRCVPSPWASRTPTVPLCRARRAPPPRQWPRCPSGVQPRSPLCPRPSGLGWWPQGPP